VNVFAVSRLEAPVATTLDVVAWEMELAAARCLMLDAMLGRVMGRLADEDQAEFMEGMHIVDLLSQQLTGLSSFTRKMSEKVPIEVSAQVDEALQGITLGALADRMTAALGGGEKGINERESAGNVDLF
jgi:hypothetical protein